MIKIDRDNIAKLVDRFGSSLGIASVILAVLILLLRTIIHFPFFDESLHVHYLWLLSSGFLPGTDFYCHYPVLAYLFLAPFFDLLPDSAYVVLVLRYISVAVAVGTGALFLRHGRRIANDPLAAVIPLALLASSGNIGPFLVEFSIDPFAAAAAVGALVMFFRTPGERTVAVSAGLSLLSVLITPKYVFPLFFGLVGHTAAYFLASRDKLRTARAVCAGGAVSLAFVLIVHWMSGVSFLGNLSATLTTSKIVQWIHEAMPYSFVFQRLINKPVFIAVAVLGLAGWAVRSRGRLDHVTLSGAGMLIGLILFFFTVCLPLEQYQMPIYLTLALFVPFAFAWPGNALWAKALRSAVFAVVLIVVAGAYPALLREFMGTSIYMRDANNPRIPKGPPAVKALGDMDRLLRLIPKNERLVALWPHNPMLRKDLTGITWDERPSYTEVLRSDDPNAAFFDPRTYAAALSAHMPALIAPNKLDINYPPGWYELTVDFLARNAAAYVKVPSSVQPDAVLYLRRDLMPLENRQRAQPSR